jgi:uncharacterized metal-binding protein
MIQVASLGYGVIFKKAFSKPHIFKAFVKDLSGSHAPAHTLIHKYVTI